MACRCISVIRKPTRDDAERAVRAGLELVAAVGGLKTHATLQTRVGIATGQMCGCFGVGRALERALAGLAPVLDSRLAHSSLDKAEAALDLLSEALAAVEDMDERMFEAELHRVIGDTFVSMQRQGEAEVEFTRAPAGRFGAWPWPPRLMRTPTMMLYA
jgi:hypothetical protein